MTVTLEKGWNTITWPTNWRAVMASEICISLGWPSLVISKYFAEEDKWKTLVSPDDMGKPLYDFQIYPGDEVWIYSYSETPLVIDGFAEVGDEFPWLILLAGGGAVAFIIVGILMTQEK